MGGGERKFVEGIFFQLIVKRVFSELCDNKVANKTFILRFTVFLIFPVIFSPVLVTFSSNSAFSGIIIFLFASNSVN